MTSPRRHPTRPPGFVPRAQPLTPAVSGGPHQSAPRPPPMPTVARPLQCVVRWGEDAPPWPRAPAPRAPGGAPHATDARQASRAPPAADPHRRSWVHPSAPHPPRGPPNATRQALEIAGAKNERRLFPVACTRLLGSARLQAHSCRSRSYGSSSTSGTWAKATSYLTRLPRFALSSRYASVMSMAIFSASQGTKRPQSFATWIGED